MIESEDLLESLSDVHYTDISFMPTGDLVSYGDKALFYDEIDDFVGGYKPKGPYFSMDDAYKLKFGNDYYVRLAVLKMNENEDIGAYLAGDYEAFKRKYEAHELVQLNLIISSFKPSRDTFVREKIKETLSEMDYDNEEIFACFFFEPYLRNEYDNITFASGHKSGPYKQLVEIADKATKWEPDGRRAWEFIKDLNKYWLENPELRHVEEFEFEGRKIEISPAVREKYADITKSEYTTITEQDYLRYSPDNPYQSYAIT